MADFLSFVFATVMAYLFSLAGVEYAQGKSKKTRRILICLITLAFSIINGWMMYINLNTISINEVDKAWRRYTTYCRQEHISWNEITFPEWLSIEASSD